MLKLKEQTKLGRKVALNEEDINELIAMYNDDFSWEQIAEKLSISRGTVGNYLRRIREGEYND